MSPAPSGRSRMPSKRSAMSSNSLRVSSTFSSSSTLTIAMPVRDVDSIFSTWPFSAILASIFLVTSCSMRSAAAPGHGTRATAWRTAMSGSLRCGMLR